MKKSRSLPDTFLPGFDRLVRASSATDRRAPASGGPPAPGVLIALSGGPDSVALLRLALIWAEASGGYLAAAHFNHLLRGEDADRDEAFCRDLCDRHRVTLHVRRKDPRPPDAPAGHCPEDAARTLRRDFFEHLMAEDPRLHCCATGHHLDDQQETMLMRLFRGTGPGGLAGIRPASGAYIHPLLEIPRRRILLWLDEIGQPYRRDPTNEGDTNTRARVRNELLPLVRDIFGAGAGDCLLRLGRLAARDDAYLDELAGARRDDCAAADGGLAIDRLLALPDALASRLIRERLRSEGCDLADLSESHIERLLTWLPESRSGGRCDLVGGWQAVRAFSALHFKAGPASDPRPDAFILGTRAATPEEMLDLGPENGDLPAPGRRYTLTCPPDGIRGEIRWRPWRSGDRISPLGMDGSRRISDILREKKVAVDDRSRVLIVEDDIGPFWIVNLLRAERTRLLPSDAPGITITVDGYLDNQA